MLGIHLCGQLSVQAVELFNNSPAVTFLALKPCCLPQLWAGMPPVRWGFANGNVIDARQVGVKGRFVKNVWRGPPRSTMASKFSDWGKGLFTGINCPDSGQCKTPQPANRKESERLRHLWPAGSQHYQTLYIWAYKPFATTSNSAESGRDEIRPIAPTKVLRKIAVLRTWLQTLLAKERQGLGVDLDTIENFRSLMLRLAGNVEDWQGVAATKSGQHQGSVNASDVEMLTLDAIRHELWRLPELSTEGEPSRVGRELLLIYARYDLGQLDAAALDAS